MHQPSYDGLSHSRMTRSMEQRLTASEFKVLAVLRRLIPDGHRKTISNADIAKRAMLSESMVSTTIRAMDGTFLRRHAIAPAGFAIEILPPPEVQRKESR